MMKHQNNLKFLTHAPYALLLALGLLVAACDDSGAGSDGTSVTDTEASADVGNPPAGGEGDASTPAETDGSGAALGDMALGPVDAPVTVIEYASLTCSHCANFHRSTYPRLKENFIDTGKIRFIMRDYPLDRYALEASILARCGGEDKYFDIIKALFEGQEEWAFRGGPAAIRDGLRDYAEKFGISDDQYDACLADKTLEARLVARISEGQNRYNVNSTPTLIIDGKKYEGSPVYTEVAKHLMTVLHKQ